MFVCVIACLFCSFSGGSIPPTTNIFLISINKLNIESIFCEPLLAWIDRSIELSLFTIVFGFCFLFVWYVEYQILTNTIYLKGIFSVGFFIVGLHRYFLTLNCWFDYVWCERIIWCMEQQWIMWVGSRYKFLIFSLLRIVSLIW